MGLQHMKTVADMKDEEDSRSRDAVGQNQAHWAGKRQQCPGRHIVNGGLGGSVSISCRVADNKEASCPVYQTGYSGSGDGVLPNLLDTAFQRRTAEAAAAGSRNGSDKRWEVGGITNKKIIKRITRS